MSDRRDEEEQLRSVVLENAQSIFLARQRAEEDLLRAKEEIAKLSEWRRVTLKSIGDGVVTTDRDGRILSLNGVAQDLCGWTEEDAHGRALPDVFRIVDQQTGQPLENPADRALREGHVVGLPSQAVLSARNGRETPIHDSAAPIRDEAGRVHGVVLVFRSVAEQRRTEAALRARERELADFFDNASVGLHWVGPDGLVLRVNRAELELLGYSRDEYVGHHIGEFHADRDVADEMLGRLAAGETLRDHEARMVCKDGSIKHVLIDSSVMWEDGRFVHTRSFIRDITDRKRAEEAQARLAAIVESSQDAIISKTLDTRIVSWNAGAEYLFGYRADEAIGQPITMLIPPDRHDEEREILERLSRGERVEHYETVRVSKSGRRIEVSLTISPVRDGSGRIVGASKIARDVTARKRAEQRLSAQNGVATALAESAGMAEAAPRILRSICESVDWDLGVLWLVDETQAVLRCAEVFAVPSNPAPGFEAASREQVFAPGAGVPGRVWSTGSPAWVADVSADDDFRRAAAAAAEGLHSALAFPIFFGSRVLGVLEFLSREVRERDAVVLQVMRSIGSQVGQFMERRRAEAALRDSEERLREADRRKDEFLAMLSHELRNPLAPIRNAVQILRAKGPPVPELQWATELIDRQVHHMTRMVDDLLDVSRITQGKVELRKVAVELGTVVSTAVEASRPLIEKWGHRLTVTIPPRPILLDADPTRLAQMVSNLLNNAAKYTDHGGRISLTAQQEDGRVVIRVKDNGIGIPAEMLHRVFDVFTQLDRSLDHAEGGLGIGLTLVRRLAEMHGGSVEAKSEGPGKGSEFLVRLPVAASLLQESGKGSVAAEPAAARLRILVVDDNLDAADSLAMVLRMMGHDVETAHDGLEAVGVAGAFRPDVALLDIGLPKLNGYEVARRIREQGWAAGVVLVALTGWGQEEDRQRSREAGFDQHIIKPVDFESLQKILAGIPAAPEGSRTRP